MTTPLVNYFKAQSKVLLDAVRAGERGAALRANMQLHDGTTDFGLMKAQFVVAREGGFNNWKSLLQASEDDLRAAMGKQTLNSHNIARYTAPWELQEWPGNFSEEPRLTEKLQILAEVFSPECFQGLLATLSLAHPVASDLLWLGSRARLLALAGELLRNRIDAIVPMAGRLRDPKLYQPTVSEFLVAPLLAPLGGELIWQPEGNGPGCDYRVNHAEGVLLGEVKRLSRSRRVDAEETKRGIESMQRRIVEGQSSQNQTRVFTDDEERTNTSEDARRLYRHVRKAARQLEASAKVAAGNAWRDVPGVLFLDAEGNSYITNVIPWIEGWMSLPWAQAIDLIVFFDYRPRNGVWGPIAEPLRLPRSNRALNIFERALGTCENGHFHVSTCPPGKCDLPFGF